MTVITRDSDLFDNITFDSDEAQNIEHTYYAYGVRRWVTDDYAVVIRDDAYALTNRLTEDEAHEWLSENEWIMQRMNSALNRATYHETRSHDWRAALSESREHEAAMRIAFDRALKVVAEKGRDYARDNELCENYERFLMLGVNREAVRISDPYLLDNYGIEVHNDDSKVGELYRMYMREFVRYATRTRKATVVVGKQHNAYLTRNDASSAVLGDEVPNYYGDSQYSVKGEPVVMTYEECVKANNYAIRNGWSYAANAFGESADGEEC